MRVLKMIGKTTIAIMATDADIDPFREMNEPIGCSAGLGRLPQISLPLATVDGMPLCLGLAAAPGNDEMLLDIAVALAEAGVAHDVPIPDIVAS